MFNLAKKKIDQTKIQEKPFPFLFVKNLISKEDLNNLNKVLPNYDSILDDEVLYQSSSKTKKTILPKSKNYKILNKNKEFKKINLTFQKLKPVIFDKFEKYINKYLKKKIYSKSLKYHNTYSVMKNGYIKSPHIDRRDHLIHMIFYPSSNPLEGGEICIHQLKQKQKIFDVFPINQSLKISKKIKVYNNSCLIILNVPWAYHSVSLYKSKIDRKYFYMVYDFPVAKSGSKYKYRKAGFNQNQFWKNTVKIKSLKRKRIFLTE
tara:strand:- start:1935 stop:2720 length:786 start_codon:yes stop_codon:yes gene_type:complete